MERYKVKNKILNNIDLIWDFPVNFVFNFISLHLFNLFQTNEAH